MSNIDTSDLDDFAKTLIEYSIVEHPKKSKKFLQQEGNKLRKKTLSKAKSLTNKRTGNYYKGIKRGKVYSHGSKNNKSVRVYGGSPHAHLVEYGHRQVTKDGKEVGYVEGKRIYEKSKNEFESEFNKDCENFAEDMLKELSE